MGEFEDSIKQGDALFDRGKFLDSIRSYLRALELQASDDQTLGDLHYRLSQSFHEMDRKRTEESVQHGQKALELHRKVDDTESVVGDLLNLAYIMLDVNDDKAAEDYIHTALKETAGRPDLEAEVKLTLADMYSSSRKKKMDAKSLYEEVAELSNSSGLYESYFAAVYGLISLVRDSGDKEAAFENSMKALDDIDRICSGVKNKKERSSIRKSLSFMYDMASDLAMEMEDVTRAIEIAERMNRD